MQHMDVQSIHEEAKKCVLCGRCLAVCPVYEFTRMEEDSPRGKLFLISQYNKLTPLSVKLIFPCLLCGNCEEECPMDIRILDIFLSLRFHYRMEERPEDITSSGFFYLVSGEMGKFEKSKGKNRKEWKTKLFCPLARISFSHYLEIKKIRIKEIPLCFAEFLENVKGWKKRERR